MDGRRGHDVYLDGASLEACTLELAKSMSLTMSLNLDTVFDSFCKAPYTELAGDGDVRQDIINCSQGQSYGRQQLQRRGEQNLAEPSTGMFPFPEPSTTFYQEHTFSQGLDYPAFQGAVSTTEVLDFRSNPTDAAIKFEAPGIPSTRHSLSSTGTSFESAFHKSSFLHDGDSQAQVRVQSPSPASLFKGPPPVQTGTSEWDSGKPVLDFTKFQFNQQATRDCQMRSAFELPSRDSSAKDRQLDDLKAQINLLKAEKGEALEQLEKAREDAAQKDIRIADLEWDYANATGGSARPPSRDQARRTGVFTPQFDFDPNTPLVVCLPTGQTRTITVQQGAKLPWQAFVQLYTHHVNIATQLFNRRPLLPNSTEIHLYESLGRQLSLVMVCQCITVPRNLYQTMCAKMQEEVCYARPPKALWLRIAEELCLSVQQQQALLVHRRDYQGTIQEVLRDRAAVIAEFANSAADPIESSIQALALPYLRLHGHMRNLKQTLDQGHAITSTFASWVMHECLTPSQLTTMFVRSFPFVPDVLSIANAVAQCVGEPDAPPLHPGTPVQIPRRARLTYGRSIRPRTGESMSPIS